MIPEIEKNIELPKPNYKEKWAFHRLEVGDSITSLVLWTMQLL